MTTETPDLQAIVERLERLEKQDVRLKRAGLSVLLVVSAALLMGQARPFRTVEAERFILRDVSGKRRATLAVAADESVSLTLGDSTGRVRASLSVGKPGASLNFADPSGKVKETFSDEGLMFFDNAGDPRVALWHAKNSPSLDLSGSLPQTNSRMCEPVFSNPPLSQPHRSWVFIPLTSPGPSLFAQPALPLTKFAQECERKHVL